MPDRIDRQLAARRGALRARRATRLDRASGPGEFRRGERRGRRGTRIRGREPVGNGACRQRRQADGARVSRKAQRQSLQPGAARHRHGAGQLPHHGSGDVERRAPHRALLRRDVVSGARRPVDRHHPAGDARRRQAPRHPALFRRLGARRRKAQRQQSEPDGETPGRRRRLELPVRSQGRRPRRRSPGRSARRS